VQLGLGGIGQVAVVRQDCADEVLRVAGRWSEGGEKVVRRWSEGGEKVVGRWPEGGRKAARRWPEGGQKVARVGI
jgi:hypothetical protein